MLLTFNKSVSDEARNGLEKSIVDILDHVTVKSAAIRSISYQKTILHKYIGCIGSLYLSLNHSNQSTPVSTWVYPIFVIYTKDQLVGEPLNTWNFLKKILNEAFVTVISFAFNKS